MSLTSPLSTPAWIDAPTATASSGLTPLCGVLAGELVHQVGDRGHAGGAADEDHVVDLRPCRGRRRGSPARTGRGTPRAGRAVSSWNFARGEREVEVQRTVARRGDERQVDRGLLQRRRARSSPSRPLPSGAATAILSVDEVDAVRVLELGDQPVDDALVPVVAAEVRVAGGRLHLEHAVADLEHRHVERAAAEVEDEDRLVVAFLVEPVRERGRGGLVDDAQHLEARDLAGLLGGLALGVVEVRGHGDDGLGDGVAEVGLGVALQLLQDAGGDLLRVVRLAVDVDRPVGAHVALDRADRAIGVGDRLALGDLADEDLAGLRERDDRRGGAGALGVGDDDGLARLEDRDDGVGGAEVDADGLGHGCASGSMGSSERVANVVRRT